MIFRSALIVFTLGLVGCASTPKSEPYLESIGVVTEANGIPTLTRRARPYMPGKESKIFSGDILRTDVSSSLVIAFKTGSQLSLAPRSELHIENVSLNEGQWSVRLTLASGALELGSDLGSDSGNQALNLQTNIARLATYNPNLWVGYSAGHRRLDIVSLGTEEIRINNPDGFAVLSAPLEAVAITPGAAPQAKTIWSDTKLESTRQTFNRLQAQN